MTAGAHDNNVTEFIMALYDWEEQQLKKAGNTYAPGIVTNVDLFAQILTKYPELRGKERRDIIEEYVKQEGFTYELSRAVLKYQTYLLNQGKIDTISNAGAIDGITWKSLGLRANLTLQQEFGHVLGLFDAYSYAGHLPEELGTFVNPSAPYDRAADNDIMRDRYSNSKEKS